MNNKFHRVIISTLAACKEMLSVSTDNNNFFEEIYKITQRRLNQFGKVTEFW
jgi:hypothetical protein